MQDNYKIKILIVIYHKIKVVFPPGYKEEGITNQFRIVPAKAEDGLIS